MKTAERSAMNCGIPSFELYNSSFVKQLADWCGQHQLILTGHYPCEDGLTDQIAGSGPVMRYYADMQLPGIDHLGSRVASPVLMKQPASIARQFGNGHVLSETFGGSGWGVSFAQLAWIWGRAVGAWYHKTMLSFVCILNRRKKKTGLPRLFFLSGAMVGRISLF